MRRIFQPIVAALPLLVAAGFAHAELQDRGGGLIYDTTLNITWLQNANAIAGSSYDDGWSPTDGRTSFQNAQAFAAGFSYFDPANSVTYSDWRLAQGIDLGAPGGFPAPPFSGAGCDWQYSGYDCGYNMAPTSSELVHLWYVDLGNLSEFFDTPATPFIGTPRPGVQGVDWGTLNTGPFIDFQNYVYWSAIINPVDPTDEWRHFYSLNGRMSWRLDDPPDKYSMLVADGDIASVAVNHVAEPETYAMMLAGLGLLGLIARRRKKQIVA